MKEILQVKMDLASIFILLLNWVVLNYLIAQMILDNSCSLNFLIYHLCGTAS